jgi:hypothetical protein
LTECIEDGDSFITTPFLYSKPYTDSLKLGDISPISIMQNADMDKFFKRHSSMSHLRRKMSITAPSAN